MLRRIFKLHFPFNDEPNALPHYDLAEINIEF
jgi:hypothetical protein